MPDITELDPRLRDNVRLLGDLLGEVILEDRGPAFFDTIERIRTLAKAWRAGDAAALTHMQEVVSRLREPELVHLARAFHQFLNLSNIAEQFHRIRVSAPPRENIERTLAALDADGQAERLISELDIELVLTAHPTEVMRRTLIQKYDAVASTLAKLDREPEKRDEHSLALKRVIAEAWHTDEIRHERPSPQDEAKWGFAVVEQSLWDAAPRMVRAIESATGTRLPVTCCPVRFATWMGGDRDGNPNVTADVTREILMLARWMAADLYLRDVEQLNASLSMHEAGATVRKIAGADREPYRVVLKQVRERLIRTRDWAERLDMAPPAHEEVYLRTEELLAPLESCYKSLVDCGMQTIADGALLDTLRRLGCFGVHLLSLDIRQSSDRHTAVIREITDWLGISTGKKSYTQWSEQEKVEWLLKELQSRRPLFPTTWPVTDESAEVLATCRLIAREGGVAIKQYVISMASTPSDVLAVILLLKSCGLRDNMKIVPLFETLDDLDNAAECVEQLLEIDWYHDYCNGHQQIMLGYSDSAKDAGQLAASWAQYRAQEAIANVARAHDIKLTFFHGRGGAVGRGGAPAHEAILSQPPGSVDGSFRVTEQGEMIRWTLGLADTALETLTTYLTAVLEATVSPPKEPDEAWRECMDVLTEISTKAYRDVVREDPEFLDLFQSLTPQAELETLALGSRPARRREVNDIDSLRAIPWVFAWTQIRLMLPAWLGTEAAMSKASDAEDVLRDMRSRWPFFHMHMDMLEMVLAKADPEITKLYEQRLLMGRRQQHSAGELRARLERLIAYYLELSGQEKLLQHNVALQQALSVRNTYLDPLHLLQAELLAKTRGRSSESIEQALKVTMAGIASGLRNTG